MRDKLVIRLIENGELYLTNYALIFIGVENSIELKLEHIVDADVIRDRIGREYLKVVSRRRRYFFSIRRESPFSWKEAILQHLETEILEGPGIAEDEAECLLCKRPLQPHFVFCPYCGGRREGVCGGCGEKIEKGFVFCPKCGSFCAAKDQRPYSEIVSRLKDREFFTRVEAVHPKYPMSTREFEIWRYTKACERELLDEDDVDSLTKGVSDEVTKRFAITQSDLSAIQEKVVDKYGPLALDVFGRPLEDLDVEEFHQLVSVLGSQDMIEEVEGEERPKERKKGVIVRGQARKALKKIIVVVGLSSFIVGLICVFGLLIASILKGNTRPYRTMYCNVEIANVRRGPGTNYSVAGVLGLGEDVLVVERRGNWLKIRKDSIRGFVHESLLTKERIKGQGFFDVLFERIEERLPTVFEFKRKLFSSLKEGLRETYAHPKDVIGSTVGEW
jgi:hypothetical protein